MRLAGKVAIVTGAGSGFGDGIARRFAAEGARVTVNDIDPGSGERVAADIVSTGGTARFLEADVTDDGAVGRMVDAVVAAEGRLDIFVANAGITHRRGPLAEVDEAEFDRVYAVNVKSLYLAARHVVPQLRRQGGGVILVTASTAGLRPRPGLTWYNGSKGAAIVIAKSMAAELAPDRIRVNCICPVIGETGLLERFMGAPDTPENRDRIVRTIPLGRMSRPADVANAAVYLAEDASDFVTGVALEVDGGRTI